MFSGRVGLFWPLLFVLCLLPVVRNVQLAPHAFVDAFMRAHDLMGTIMHLPMTKLSKASVVRYRKAFE